jgi:hypothetical protein
VRPAVEMTTFPPAREAAQGRRAMATEPKQPRPEQDAPERKTQEEEPRRPSKADEAREDGMPGYGQPDEEVREQSIPEQEW